MIDLILAGAGVLSLISAAVMTVIGVRYAILAERRLRARRRQAGGGERAAGAG